MTLRAIRQSHEAPFFALWQDPAILVALAHPRFLTTARYEPILRHNLGQGHIDLLFESGALLTVLGGVRLDPNGLLTRHRSPLIWPASIAAILPSVQLVTIEDAIVPWLRAIARGRAMAAESIRSFVPSERFVQARAAGLVGSVPLAQATVAMAPFMYGRRFAAGAHVALDCLDAALGQAILADLATSFAYGERSRPDAFTLAWYGVTPPRRTTAEGAANLVIGGPDCMLEAPVVIAIGSALPRTGTVIDVPLAAGWDVLFTFNGADAPAVAQFEVTATELPLRDAEALAIAAPVGGSSGLIVLAIGAEASAMRGCDVDEVESFGERLRAEGFTVHVVSSTADSVLADAQLVHIFGAPAELHTTAFAEVAFARGIDVVFDLPPQTLDGARHGEDLYVLMHRAAQDDAEIDQYLAAFAAGSLVEPTGISVELSPGELAQRTTRFANFAQRALAIFVLEEERAATYNALLSERIFARGTFLEPEPKLAYPIAHLVPATPFAFAHGPIGSRSHILSVAFAAERHGIPLVIAGPVFDVDYLHTIGAAAPSVIVLADAAPEIVSSLYRRASAYIDAALRPRSAAGLLRAVACGALPVLAGDSPLSRLTATAAPLFRSAVPADCAAAIAQALHATDRAARIDELRRRLMPRCDPAFALRSVVSAYARAATMV